MNKFYKCDKNKKEGFTPSLWTLFNFYHLLVRISINSSSLSGLLSLNLIELS